MGVYGRFADLLDYPGTDVEACVDACLAELADAPPDAREALMRFREEARHLGLSGLEEAYTAAFDMDVHCTPYVGHRLFGENARRGLFMVRLAADYRRHGFAAPAEELPDHLAVMLRYLDAVSCSEGVGFQPRCDELDELIRDAIVPAAQQLAEALECRRHPYAPVLRAMLVTLDRAACAGGERLVGTTA